ncbi:MAG: hypothetical protein JWN14_4544, partial [Chthonomonadales bacterium]|nr:hypothetical protein [Chthonomonadales bacterium]
MFLDPCPAAHLMQIMRQREQPRCTWRTTTASGNPSVGTVVPSARRHLIRLPFKRWWNMFSNTSDPQAPAVSPTREAHDRAHEPRSPAGSMQHGTGKSDIKEHMIALSILLGLIYTAKLGLGNTSVGAWFHNQGLNFSQHVAQCFASPFERNSPPATIVGTKLPVRNGDPIGVTRGGV